MYPLSSTQVSELVLLQELLSCPAGTYIIDTLSCISPIPVRITSLSHDSTDTDISTMTNQLVVKSAVRGKGMIRRFLCTAGSQSPLRNTAAQAPD